MTPNPNLPLVDLLLNPAQVWEVALLALTVWREARGESWQGKLGVAWSIRNRTMHPGQDWWGNDWEEVILKKWQYSSISDPNDPNIKLLPGDPRSDPSWSDCLTIACKVYSNSIADPTGGATHYHSAFMATPPAWVRAPGTSFHCRLGNHLFYTAA